MRAGGHHPRRPRGLRRQAWPAPTRRWPPTARSAADPGPVDHTDGRKPDHAAGGNEVQAGRQAGRRHGATKCLKGVMTERAPAARNELDGGRTAAGKTGTTDKTTRRGSSATRRSSTTAVWVGTPTANNRDHNIALRGESYTVFGARSPPRSGRRSWTRPPGPAQRRTSRPADKVPNGDNVSIPSVQGRRCDARKDLESLGFTVNVGRRGDLELSRGYRRLHRPRRPRTAARRSRSSSRRNGPAPPQPKSTPKPKSTPTPKATTPKPKPTPLRRGRQAKRSPTT